METYTWMRAFADSWFLIVMFAFFVGTCVFAFWPTQAAARRDAASIPFRDAQPDCDQNCADCACNSDILKAKNRNAAAFFFDSFQTVLEVAG